MKIIISILSAGLMAASIAEADVVSLNLLAAGDYSNPTIVTSSQSYAEATFDIVYTVGATSGGSNTFVASSGSQMGVGDEVQASGGGKDITLDGGNDEFMSFTGLSIENFNGGTSGLVIEDITGLTFTGLSVNNAANARDQIDVSFDNYATADFVNLDSVTAEYTIDLTALSTYSSPETDLYITPNYNWTTDRIGITGIEVAYTIPEPATLGLISSFGFGILFIRRRFKI